MKKRRLTFAAFIFTFFTTIVCQAADTDQIRFYIGGRAGGAFFTNTHLMEQVRNESNDDAYGAVVGLNLGKHLGIEIAADYHDSSLTAQGVGKIGELAVWHIIPHLRVRYPLANGKLTPYFLGGVGVGFTEFNDQTPRGAASFPSFGTGGGPSVTGSVGAGTEYFVANNIAIGVETRFLFFDVDIEVEGKHQKADLNRVLFYGTFRLFFPEAKPASSR